jgi:hypothetical protein
MVPTANDLSISFLCAMHRGERRRSQTVRTMMAQLPALLLLFGLIFGLNLIPVFAPPTWMALTFIGFEFTETNPLLLALVAAAAATLGRITLAKCSHLLL